MKRKSIINKSILIYVLILAVYLVVGLRIFRDYGASADEHIQIEGGHVMWNFLNGKLFGKEPVFPELPPLDSFQNRYYGQAATFPTVLIEAMRGFRMDSSTVLRLRHLWNFLSFFAGLCCFTLFLHQIFGPLETVAGLLFMILLPRIFGDVFYNDRDVLFISWILISLFAFHLFYRKQGFFRGILFAFCLAMTVNTRIFGLLLLLLPGLFILRCGKQERKFIWIILIFTVLFWFLLYPMAWGNPLHTLPNALHHFRTQQRSLDTADAGTNLFMGEIWPENALPWYYLPVWILISTPLATLLFSVVGCAVSFRSDQMRKTWDEKTLLDIFMALVALASLGAVILLHLTLYTGWRHFYYLYVPMVWFAIRGFSALFTGKQVWIRWAALVLVLCSFGESIRWMAYAHPYEIVYFNPVFRKWAPGKFDRDYWVLSTTELMDHLKDTAADLSLTVVDRFAFIDYTIIGLSLQDRERFHYMGYSIQRSPYEYLFHSYAEESGNDAEYPYYEPIYAVERDGMKLSEIFRRSHNGEIRGVDLIINAHSNVNKDQLQGLCDNDYDTFWSGAEQHKADEFVELELKETTELTSIEVFPGDYTAGFENLEISVSEDGRYWQKLTTTPKGTNGWAFDPTAVKVLRLESPVETEYPWGIRELLFYTK